MVEYIFDAIRAVAGQDAEITAIITDDDGNYMQDACYFMLHDKDGTMLYETLGECKENLWCFTIPAEITEGMVGRYWYCIGGMDGNMCFLKPFYLE